MPVPATTGQLRKRVQDMQVGDYLACRYKASTGSAGDFGFNVASQATIELIGGSLVRSLTDGDKVSYAWDDTASPNEGVKFTFSKPKEVVHVVVYGNDSYPLRGAELYVDGVLKSSTTAVVTSTNPWAVSFSVPIMCTEIKIVRPSNSANQTISEVEICIPYDSNATELPITGVSNPDGIFYFVKVDKGLLVADRIVQHSISWDALNTGRFIQGRPTYINGVLGIIRSLTGGVAYSDANGNRSTIDLGYGGWPTINEWDTYIVNFPSYLIQSGKTLDDVFHWNVDTGTWCQDTHFSASTTRTMRGRYVYFGTAYGNLKYLTGSSSNLGGVTWGFRPVFEYKEV